MNRKKRFLAFAVAAVMTIWAPSAIYAQNAGEKEIVIFHTNDSHGRLVASDSIIGISVVAEIKAETPNSLLVDAGDTFHGLPFATMNKGADVVELMNQAGYDVMTPGNHDFNYGYKRLLELADMAEFDILSSNLKKDGEIVLPAAVTVKEVDGVKVGFFGSSTPETAWKTNPKNTEGLVFDDVVECAKDSVEALQELDVDVIVAIVHLGTDASSEETSEKLAEAVPEIDVIIDGHSHSLFEEGMVVNGVLIASAKEYEAYVGKVTLTFDASGELTDKSASVIDTETAKAEYEPNEAMTAKIADITEKQDAVLNVVIGSLEAALSSERSPGVRTQEMPLGNLAADSLRAATNADIAFVNGGGLRADMNAGDVTKRDTVAVLPFGNYGVTKFVSPAQLKEALENGVSALPESLGAFPQISGFAFECDPSLPVGSRVTNITMDGKALDMTDTTPAILMATNDFISAGGDGYTVLGSVKTENEFEALDEMLAEYISDTTQTYSEPEGRIVIAQSEPEPAAAEPEAEAIGEVALSGTAIVINCYYVNMRSGDGMTFEPITSLPKDTAVTVFDNKGGWVKVLYNGVEGWIYEKYLGN